MTDWYEMLERFSIIAESEGDIKALPFKKNKNKRGLTLNWCNIIKN